MDEYEEAVLFTFSLLESRLDRLEYILGGPQDSTKDKQKTIPDRIHRIEQSLQQLAGKTALLDEANNLRTQPLSPSLSKANVTSEQAQRCPQDTTRRQR